MSKKAKFDFEKSVERLDEIIAAIEAGDVPLEKSLALYKEGMTLAADCSEKLAAVEKEVVILSKNLAGMTERQVFALEDDDEEL